MSEVMNSMGAQAKDMERRRYNIQHVLQSQEWGWFLEYLERRYVELNCKECDSLRALSARHAAIKEIEGIFKEIGQQVKMADVAAARFKQLEIEMKDENPVTDDDNF